MKSLKVKLIVIFVLVIAISLLTLGIMSYKNTVKVVYEGYTQSNVDLVREIEESVDNYMSKYHVAIQIYSDNDTVKSIDVDPGADLWMKREFRKFLANNPEVISLYLGTEKGEMIDPTWSDIPDDYDPRTKDWYKITKEKMSVAWTQPYLDAMTNNMVISVAAPVYDHKDEFIGIVSMDVDIKSLSDQMGQIKIGNNGYPVLIDQDLKMITHNDQSMVGIKLPVKEIEDAITTQDEGIVEYEWKGDDKFATFKNFDELGWTILVALDHDEVNVLTRPILYVTIALVIICLIIGVVVAIILSKGIVKPIMQLEETMEVVKNGDLTVRSDVKTQDEIGKMALNFNIMIDHFSEMLAQSKSVAHSVSVAAEDLASSSEEVSASSEEVARTIEEIAVGASEQSSETEHGVTLIMGLSQKLEVLNRDSELMAKSAKEVNVSNENGALAMNELKLKTQENNESTIRIEEAIIELEKKSFEIGSILDTISSIADQTNLLALNASIEAARAGEHGRGFAVVAEEIRKLAEGSNEAAGTIKLIVERIQSESRYTVSVMAEVKDRSKEQESAVYSVNQVFNEINRSTETISEVISEVVNFIDGVNKDKDEIVLSIEKISAVSEEAAAASEEVTASVQQQSVAMDDVAGSAEQLNSMAEELQREINQFKI